MLFPNVNIIPKFQKKTNFFVFYDIYIQNNNIYIYIYMKRTIRLAESELHRIVKESVKRALNEVSTDTLHNAYQKSQGLTMKLPNVTHDPKVQRKFRQKHAFGNELRKRHSNEISAIDPDTAQGYEADFHEHPELRNTKAYKMAYDYIDDFDWFVNGDIDLDWWGVHDLASDVEADTQIPSSIASQAIVDYLRNEFGYEVD